MKTWNVFFSLLAMLVMVGSMAHAGDDPCSKGIDELLAREMERTGSGTATVGDTTERIIWGKWDCKSCGTKGLSARPLEGEKIAKCSHCGSPMEMGNGEVAYLGHERDAATGRVLDAESDVAKGKEEIKIAQAGADWKCVFCNASNRAGHTSCEYCGAARAADAKTTVTGEVNLGHSVEKTAADAPKGKPMKGGPSSQGEVRLSDSGGGGDGSGIPKGDPELKKKVMIGAGVTAGAVAVGGATWWALTTHPKDGKVTSMSWQHVITRQTFVPTTQRDWRDNIYPSQPVMPINGGGESAGATNIRNCSQEHHHDEDYICGTERVCHDESYQVQSGQSCSQQCSTKSQGNGSFKESCRNVCTPNYVTKYRNVCQNVDKHCSRPIYKTRCDYDTYAWSNSGGDQTSGGEPEKGTNSLPWPKVATGPHDRLLHSEAYKVNVSYKDGKDDKIFEMEPKSEQEFLSWRIGDKLILQVRNIGGVAEYKRAP